MLKQYLPELSGEEWRIVVWHQGGNIDLPNRYFRNKRPMCFEWEDASIPVIYRQATILSHRLPFNQDNLILPQMRRTYQQVMSRLGGSPDCVWTVTLSSALLWDYFQQRERLSIPFFLQEHSSSLNMHLRKSYKRELAFDLPSRMRQVVVVAERQLSQFTALSPEFCCRIIWNAVDPLFLNQGNKTPDPDLLLFVGRLSQEKGLVRLIDAFSIALHHKPKLRLRIVGYGGQEHELRNQVKALGLERAVEFTGAKNSESIVNLLDEAGIFILPSYYENCPVALLEAQSRGVPSMVTINGGSEKVLLPGNGMAVEDLGSGQQLAASILEISNCLADFDRTEIRTRSLAAFAPEVFARKMYELIKEVMA